MADVVRLLVWSLGDSQTTLDELREHLPSAELARVRDLIGKDPEVAEEFDVE